MGRVEGGRQVGGQCRQREGVGGWGGARGGAWRARWVDEAGEVMVGKWAMEAWWTWCERGWWPGEGCGGGDGRASGE